jgi:two-component system sensor histidine kinase DegS
MKELLLNYKQQNNQLLFLSKKILKSHEEERKRIAREIHDGPAQSSVNLSLKAELCKKYLANNDLDKVESEIGILGNNIRETVKEIRTIIYDLKPSYLDDGLIAALKNRFYVFTDSTGIKVDFNISGSDDNVEYYITSAIYRIVQESLSNISKHAEASNVIVDLKISDKNILLSVCDNGKGFNYSNSSSKSQHSLKGGFGLEGLRERVELIRGTFSIKSELGQGTIISISIPIS